MTLAGLIVTILGIVGWFLFMSIPSQSMPSEAALGWLVLFPFITLGSLLFGVIGFIIMILGLVLKGKSQGLRES